jgi:hypothetical protein
VKITKNEKTAGVENGRLRNYLRKFGDGHVGAEGIMEVFSLRMPKAEHMLDELLKLGLIESARVNRGEAPTRYSTTILGSAFGMASAAKAVSRKTATRLLREFLGRALLSNENEALVYRIESVVVFGSYLSEVASVNDVDLSVELVRRHPVDSAFEDACAERINLAFRQGRRFQNMTHEILWPRIEILLYLKNRSRTLSLCDWDSLRGMPTFPYAVLIGDKRRVSTFVENGQLVDLREGIRTEINA